MALSYKMSAMAEMFKRAPRWFRVIRWKNLANTLYVGQKNSLQLVYAPMLIIFYAWVPDKFVTMLFFKRPQTQEEFDRLAREWRFYDFSGNPRNLERDYEPGQYDQDMKPLFDLAERRKYYPEYYAGRYDGFRKTWV